MNWSSMLYDFLDFKPKRNEETEVLDANILSITVNEPKKIVTVVFGDNDVQMAACTKDDKFDVNVGVALCIAYHIYGTKNAFHKEVEKKASYAKPRRQLKAAQEKQKDKQ